MKLTIFLILGLGIAVSCSPYKSSVQPHSVPPPKDESPMQAGRFDTFQRAKTIHCVWDSVEWMNWRKGRLLQNRIVGGESEVTFDGLELSATSGQARRIARFKTNDLVDSIEVNYLRDQNSITFVDTLTLAKYARVTTVFAASDDTSANRYHCVQTAHVSPQGQL